MAHAELSPSSAARWLTCPGSVVLCKGLPDTSSAHADEGTLAHAWAAYTLDASQPAPTQPANAEMQEAVGRYVRVVQDLVESTQGTLRVEQRLPLDSITGEAGAHGTADVVILAEDELIIADLKYGRGVAVSAEYNEQLQIYALAALAQFDMLGPFKRVRMCIVQPRLHSVSEWVQTVDELQEFAEEVASGAHLVAEAGTTPRAPGDVPWWNATFLSPSDAGCRWCKAKATCPALRSEVTDLVFGTASPEEFESATDPIPVDVRGATDDRLAVYMASVDMVEGWCKAVRAEVERRLFDGTPVQGWKLVQGRKGPRKWTDPEAAEAMLRKTFRLPVEKAYELTLISPTAAERLATAGDIGARQWPKLQDLITQPEGKPSVAPESDKRPALTPAVTAADFEPVTTTA